MRFSWRRRRPATGLPWMGLLLLSLFGFACASDDDLKAQQAAFGGSLVVPQIIPSFDPLGYLHLFYDGIDIGAAQQMPPERLVLQPMVSFNLSHGARTGPPYVLLAVDPDASAVHTSQSCSLHWMLSDVYFDETTGHLASGFVSARYVRPNPPEGPLHHRYVFLLFEQPVLFLPPVFPRQLTGSRLHFNLPTFVADFALNAPVGGNFLKSYWTGVEIPPSQLEQLEDEQDKQRIMNLKAHANPYLAALIGSIMGFLYGATNAM